MRQPSMRALLVVCVAVLVACTKEQEATPQEPAEPNVVMLSSADNAFQAPDTIAAGWTSFQFTNNGNDIHYAHIVRLDSGRTVPELIDA